MGTGILGIRKLRKPIQRRTPQGAGVAWLRAPSPGTASGNARLAESPPLAGDLAWDLLEGARSSLNKRERDAVAINLATREFLYVISVLLAAVIRANAVLPIDVADRLKRWAQTYVGHPDHPAICSLVARAIDSTVQTDTQANQ